MWQTTKPSLGATRGVTDVDPGESDEDELATLLLNVAVHDTVRNTRDPGVYEWLPQATRDPRAGETASLV